MKRLIALAFAATVLSVGCGGKGTEPSGNNSGGSNSASSTTTYTVTLSPTNEIPAITGADATITGTAVVKITAVKEGTTVKSATVDYQITGSGFAAGTTVTGAHIHSGASSVASGSIVNDTGLKAGDMPFAIGSGSFTRNGQSLAADVAQAILANPGNFYFNVHTAASPGGAARAQLGSGGTSGGDTGGGGGPAY
jgi:hypothetical protein